MKGIYIAFTVLAIGASAMFALQLFQHESIGWSAILWPITSLIWAWTAYSKEQSIREGLAIIRHQRELLGKPEEKK